MHLLPHPPRLPSRPQLLPLLPRVLLPSCHPPLYTHTLTHTPQVLSLLRFSNEFRYQMVFPLVALFFGTGNQTPRVSAAVSTVYKLSMWMERGWFAGLPWGSVESGSCCWKYTWLWDMPAQRWT